MQTCLVGLHDSGKSTALAALWFSVADRSEHCDWYLANSDRPADAGFWLSIRDLWLKGEPLERTEHKTKPEVLKLKLRKQNGDERLEIVVPDIAGEDFEKIYESGRFPKNHSKILARSDRMVFFVRVDDYDHPVALTAPARSTTEKEKSTADDETSSWDPSNMYTGSKIIAVLRGIRELRGKEMASITIVLTAWDLIRDESTPATIMRQRFPLLDQYLRANYVFTLLGISAQGCNYEDPSSLESIDYDDIRRIKIVGEEDHHDISRIFA